MVTLIVLFCIISSGSVLGAIIYEKNYEEFLPVTLSAIVGILFVCGIFGNLKVGIFLCLGLSVLAYVYAGVKLVRGGTD